MIDVLHIASEVAPFAKTGGLADVCAALPRAVARKGTRVSVVMPRYKSIDVAKNALARRLATLEVPLGTRTEHVTIYEGKLLGGTVSVYLLDHAFFDRDGIYGEGGADYADNGVRFALLCRGALELMHKLDRWPDLVHAHDWQAGLAPLYLKTGAVAGRPIPASVFTIHNLAFQGLQPRTLVEELGLPWDAFKPETGEFFDQLSYLKVGLAYADRITTVSPRYAREIQTPEMGAGLDGFLRNRADRLVGILNGIDTEIWNPERDPHLAMHYDAADHSGKNACKIALQREVGLTPRPGVPLLGSISRLTEQKGFSLIAEAGEELARLDAQYVFLGSGERRYEDALANLVRRYPAKFAVRTGYNDPLAHRIEAGADFFLMPSRFEPCGLNQMYSLRYGTIPIVRGTGGLDDTVVDWDEQTQTGSGFKFLDFTGAALVSSVRRALALYRHAATLEKLRSRIMTFDHSWHVSGRRYLEVYDRLLAARSKHAA